MTLEQFQTLLDRHGPEPDHWPAAEGPAALALLARSRDAQRVLEAERLLAGALARMPEDRPSESLRRAILDIPLSHPLPGASRPASWLAERVLGRWRAVWAGMATASACAALGLGFVLGYGQWVELPGLTIDTLGVEGELLQAADVAPELELLP